MRIKDNKWLLAVMALSLLGLLFYRPAGVLAAQPKGVLKLALHISASADWFDPSSPSSYSSHFFLYLFHDALLKPMPDSTYSPCLAESWTISPDYKVYDFKLRKGVKFHNGDDMTAEDVVFTFKRYKGVTAKLMNDMLEKVEALNPYQVRITFKKSFPSFFENMLTGTSTIGWIVPKKYIEKVGESGYKRHPIGCGPYKLTEFKPDVRLVGEAFEDFWRKKPHIKKMEVYFVKEGTARYAMVTRGEVDVAFLMQDVLYEQVKKTPNLRLLSPLASTRWIVQMTSQWDQKSPWYDPRVRKAASLAIDRKTLADVVLPGSEPIGSIGLPGDPEGVEFPPDPYDPDRAKKLLAEAGYPKGFHAGKFYPYNGSQTPMGLQVANYWKMIGITADTVLLDRLSWTEKRRVGQMKEANFNDSISQPTIGGRLDFLFGGIFCYGNYPDIEALWEKYNKAVDLNTRKNLIANIQRLIYDKTMYISLISNTHSMAVGPRVKGYPPKIQAPKSVPLYWVSPFEDAELNE